MEGIFYFWFMWLAWIVTTFLLRKSTVRLKLGIFLMITIMMSKYFVLLGEYNIRISLLLFLFLGYYLATKMKSAKISFFIMAMTLTLAYSGILLFRIYDPVWFLFDYRLIVSLVISILAIYLGRKPTEKFTLFIISIGQGEFIYWGILGKFHSGLTIGTSASLDILAIGCFFIYIWVIAQQVITYIEQNIQKPAKEKQG
ncbi:YphA family membrane protein [Metabacillus malikii]|uniref:Uncharacterized protein n=1 Tax=Metabacillus malikii TaxID=1504265 RepID=A0ABT9ZKW9_9BACI|nr:hypothetical protein [Metabacillus malikii]MDQ0232945.1 hypothetical protein [Metabacillus malikii]